MIIFLFFRLIQNLAMLDAKVMHYSTGGDDLSGQLHVLDSQPRFQAVKPLLQDPKRLLNQTTGLAVSLVVVLAVISQIGEVGCHEPRSQLISTVPEDHSPWKRQPTIHFKELPQRAALKHSAVVASSAVTCVDVEHFSFWARDTKDVERVAVVAVEVREFIMFWWSHQNVASVHDTSNRGEAGNLEKLLGKFLRLLRPADVVVTKIENCFSNSAHHSSDSLRTWPVGVPNCVVEIVGTGETKKQEDLKNNLSS